VECPLEAIYLVCGAGGPQLKRDPLGSLRGGPLNAPSVADIPEDELVAFLWDWAGPWRRIAMPPATESPMVERLQVTPSQIGLSTEAFGDIDALVLSKGDAAGARAIQYKRVKITASTFLTREPNKLQELAKAVHQTNALATVGLAYVWLQIIVVTDARAHAGGSYLVSAPQDLIDRVHSALPLSELDERAGVVITEIVQSIDRPVHETGGFGGKIVRLAQFQEQPESLTEAIAALFAQAA
jgi:hypothetical protein